MLTSNIILRRYFHFFYTVSEKMAAFCNLEINFVLLQLMALFQLISFKFAAACCVNFGLAGLLCTRKQLQRIDSAIVLPQIFNNLLQSPWKMNVDSKSQQHGLLQKI